MEIPVACYKHLGISICNVERNGVFHPKNCLKPYSFNGFLICRRPIFGTVLNTIGGNQSWVFGVSKPSCRQIYALSNGEHEENRSTNSSKVMEKELKFQPTFDEYLKAMESIRTFREKTPVREAKGYHSRKTSTVEGIPKKPMLEGDNDKFKLSLDEDSCQVIMNTDSLEGDGLSESSSVVKDDSSRGKVGFSASGSRTLKERSRREVRVGFSEKGSAGRSSGATQDKLRYTNSSAKVERGMRNDGDKRSVERQYGRWNKNHDSCVQQKIVDSGYSKTKKSDSPHGSHSKLEFMKSLAGRSDDGVRDFDRNENTRAMNEKPFQNELKVKARFGNEDGSTNLSHANNRSEKSKLHADDVERNCSEYKTNHNLTGETNFYQSEIKIESGQVEAVNRNRMSGLDDSHVKNIQPILEESNINNLMERAKPYDYRNYVTLTNVSEVKKHGPINTEIDTQLDSGQTLITTKRGIPLKGGKSPRVNMPSKNKYESNSEMERAAFASFEEFTDIRGMPRVSQVEMEERIQKLAKWLNGADINLPEWMFSKAMRSAQIRFTDNSILRVIQVLGTYGNWRRVLQVIEWFQSRERFKSHKSRYIYTTALDVLGKAKRPVEALNVFHAMRQELPSYPDLAAYRCIAVTLGQAGHMKELLDVIDCMRSPPQKKFNLGVLEKWDPRLEPDVVVYNAVLNACIRRKQWEGAFWVLQQLKLQGLQPTSTTYGLVMEVMLACAKYSLVHEFFRKVQKSSIPNSLNYKVLVNTLWREGKTDEAVVVVDDMEKRGIVGSASLYYDLARCLCSAGRCQEALMQIDKICKVANKPLVVTYTGLIQACLESRNVQNGSYIFEQMQKFCSPNLVTYNIMLKGYLEHGMFEKAKDLFQQMLGDRNQISSKADYKERVAPDNYTFNSMLDACLAEKKWDDFSYVYQLMLHHGYHFNAKRHLRMLMEACRAGKVELLETTWKHLIQAGRIPPAPIIKERFCMKLEVNDFAGAISCITSHQISERHSFSGKAWLHLLKTNENRLRKETLVRLTHELSNIVTGNDHPHPVIQNLVTSCNEIAKNHMSETDVYSILNGRTLEPDT